MSTNRLRSGQVVSSRPRSFGTANASQWSGADSTTARLDAASRTWELEPRAAELVARLHHLAATTWLPCRGDRAHQAQWLHPCPTGEGATPANLCHGCTLLPLCLEAGEAAGARGVIQGGVYSDDRSRQRARVPHGGQPRTSGEEVAA